MGLLRSIRLKEHDPNRDVQLEVTDRYVKRSDGTIPAGPFRIRTDDQGFIRTGNPGKPDATDVYVLGDSFVESSFCPEGERFLAQAERLSSQFRYLNGGYSGATSIQLLQALIAKIYPLAGRSTPVIFFVGQSDADALNRPGTYWNDTKLWSQIKPGIPPQATDLPTGEDSTRRVVQLICQTALALEINLVMAVSPFRDAPLETDLSMRRIFGSKKEVFTNRMNTRESVRRATVEVPTQFGIKVIDFQELTQGNPEWFYDDLHLNEQGHTKFAKLLASELRERL